MIFSNSVRQLKRTPAKTALFTLLLIAAAAFLSLGFNLFTLSKSSQQRYENTFTTIGTVDQRSTTVRQDEYWDAETKSYHLLSGPGYGTPVPMSVLNFPGADYIIKPQRTIYYGSYCPEYVNGASINMGPILETTPFADCVPSSPVQLKVVKVLHGSGYVENSTVWFLDKYDPNPKKLYAGKTYIMSLEPTMPPQGMEKIGTLLVPYFGIGTTQAAPDGKRIGDGVPGNYYYDEVTDGFFDTGMGKRWLNLVAALKMYEKTIPVGVTNSTDLLMPFYNGTSHILQGWDIRAEEYKGGKNVCLIPEEFAQRNNLKVGGSVHLHLYYANYKTSAGAEFLLGGRSINYNFLNAKGEPYPVFEDGYYTIAGIYETQPGFSSYTYSLGENEVIIPQLSVKNSDRDNIASFGPMQGYNTSFQIPNGEINQFLAAWKQYGTDQLEISFYDKGYSKLESGMRNMNNLSLILLIAGLGMVASVLIFFCYLFIAKQRKRTAIERSLGLSRRKCMMSLLTGLLLVIVIGSVAGTAAGAGMTKAIAGSTAYRSYYNTHYGDAAVSTGTADTSGQAGSIQYDLPQPQMAWLSAGLAAAVSLAGMAVSVIMIGFNLNKEPLVLLSTTEKD